MHDSKVVLLLSEEDKANESKRDIVARSFQQKPGLRPAKGDTTHEATKSRHTTHCGTFHLRPNNLGIQRRQIICGIIRRSKIFKFGKRNHCDTRFAIYFDTSAQTSDSKAEI
ncbi:hypothetical protein CDAR_100461 [Caerostris darwini]|uniref:Uncharacterized protein n=1 Tax=Caerostris darwini TaxID=1538125 RepID=A0AAV4X4K6_9ARAC|nr:hypothetical protein CDAR_100461 [Caerostris darwini]